MDPSTVEIREELKVSVTVVTFSALPLAHICCFIFVLEMKNKHNTNKLSIILILYFKFIVYLSSLKSLQLSPD